MVRTKASASNSRLVGKEYKDGVNEIVNNTVVKLTDLDQKAFMLLDALQGRGKAKEACQFLKQTLEGLDRDHVSNWKAYVYTLLRGFDEVTYQAMKDAEGRRRPPARSVKKQATPPLQEAKGKNPVSDFRFNPMAPEFIPNQPWPWVCSPVDNNTPIATIASIVAAGGCPVDSSQVGAMVATPGNFKMEVGVVSEGKITTGAKTEGSVGSNQEGAITSSKGLEGAATGALEA